MHAQMNDFQQLQAVCRKIRCVCPEAVIALICHFFKTVPNYAYIESVPVHEVFRDQTVCRGRVEVFSLSGQIIFKLGHHK
jgi:hypothetical protein